MASYTYKIDTKLLSVVLVLSIIVTCFSSTYRRIIERKKVKRCSLSFVLNNIIIVVDDNDDGDANDNDSCDMTISTSMTTAVSFCKKCFVFS